MPPLCMAKNLVLMFFTSLYLLAICELYGMTFLCRCAIKFHSIVDEMAKIALKWVFITMSPTVLLLFSTSTLVKDIWL